MMAKSEGPQWTPEELARMRQMPEAGTDPLRWIAPPMTASDTEQRWRDFGDAFAPVARTFEALHAASIAASARAIDQALADVCGGLAVLETLPDGTVRRLDPKDFCAVSVRRQKR